MSGITRREIFEASALAAGALVAPEALAAGVRPSSWRPAPGNPSPNDTPVRQHLSESFYFPGEELALDEMRISFMGTNYISRIGQACNSVFVETGTGENFVFDCGAGVAAKYVAMGVPWSKMTNIFLTHLHADHMSDLVQIYCFGPSGDRLTDLHVFGPSGPIFDDPGKVIETHPEQGTIAFCDALQKLTSWHRDSFSFLPTGLTDGQDGYRIVAHELPYRTIGGLAYPYDGIQSYAKVTHFPAVHTRDGSISFKIEWNGMSVVFTGDTLPSQFLVDQAKGADVLIHEVTLSPETWATKNGNLHPGDPGWDQGVDYARMIQNSSHTSAKNFGAILSSTRPRLGVVTHFQVNIDTIVPALDDIRSQYASGDLIFATDMLVLNVAKGRPIRKRMGLFSDYSWNMIVERYNNKAKPLYPDERAQLSKFLLDKVFPNLG